MANELELREILKVVRQLERVIESALRDEQTKNEERLQKQLEAQGITVEDMEEDINYDAFEI